MLKQDLGYLHLGGSGPKPSAPLPKVGQWFEVWLVYGGIVLPTLAILIEIQFHICAKLFFDPFPSNAHVLLFSLVPFASLLAWISIQRGMVSQLGLSLFVNGMAVGVALLYALMFAPLTQQSLEWLYAYGFGLLGLAPLIALSVLWFSGDKIGKVATVFGTNFHPHHVKNAGHLVVLLAVLAVELPSTYTRVALGMAADNRSSDGLLLLRLSGSQEVMLRACYERSGRATDVLGSLYEASHPANVETMREIFYKVTGRTFNSFPIPDSARATMNHMGTLAPDGMEADDEFDMDPDIAGEMVSGVSRGLSVADSRIDAKIDSDACVSQLDWFLDFHNKSKYDREVRTRIRLPHGAAVNKASLIVEGKEYEVQITPREEARQIYKEAVAAKKNPLLVSVSGEDAVLVQCYPVPPGHNVKMHLGIVTPLALDRNLQAVMTLPQFEERNFQISEPHALCLSANNEMSVPWGELKQEHKGNSYILAGKLDGSLLAAGAGIIKIKRSDKTQFWSKGQNGNYYTEKLTDVKLSKPESLAVLIDGSGFMKDEINKICEALKTLPGDMQVSLVLAGDKGLETILPHALVTSDKFTNALKSLSGKQFVGGQKDGFALRELILNVFESDLYKAGPFPGRRVIAPQHGAILWVHGAQPLADNTKDFLKQFFQNFRSSSPLVYDMQLFSGPNQFLDGVDSGSVQKIARFGTTKDDLSLLFEEWQKPGLLNTFTFDCYGAQRPHNRPHSSQAASALQCQDLCNIDVRPNDSVNVNETCGTVEELNAQLTPVKANSAPVSSAAIGLLATAPDPAPPGQETIAQLGQLWAIAQINSKLREGNESAAHNIAVASHVVTPISSGVLVDTVPKLDVWSCPQPEISQTSDGPVISWLRQFGVFDELISGLSKAGSSSLALEHHKREQQLERSYWYKNPSSPVRGVGDEFRIEIPECDSHLISPVCQTQNEQNFELSGALAGGGGNGALAGESARKKRASFSSDNTDARMSAVSDEIASRDLAASAASPRPPVAIDLPSAAPSPIGLAYPSSPPQAKPKAANNIDFSEAETQIIDQRPFLTSFAKTMPSRQIKVNEMPKSVDKVIPASRNSPVARKMPYRVVTQCKPPEQRMSEDDCLASDNCGQVAPSLSVGESVAKFLAINCKQLNSLNRIPSDTNNYRVANMFESEDLSSLQNLFARFWFAILGLFFATYSVVDKMVKKLSCKVKA